MGYNAKVYRKQGGDQLVASNGGTITVESGGTLDVQSGATLNLPLGVAPTVLTLAQGNVLIGDANGYAAAVSVKTTGQILVGNGTTIASVAVSGDATIAANGVLTVASGAISTGKLAASAATGAKISVAGFKAASFTGANTNGAITLTGAVAGERVAALYQINADGAISVASSFESSISSNNAIQQTSNSNLSTNRYAVILIPASA